MKKTVITAILVSITLFAVREARLAPLEKAVALKVAGLTASLKKDHAGQRAYEWIETIVVSQKGKVKSGKQNRCYYGADGALQKVPVQAGAQSAGRMGPLKKRKKKELEAAVKSAIALIKKYVPPSSDRIQAARDEGRMMITPGAGRPVLTITDYLKTGDKMELLLDAANNSLLSMDVSTYDGKKMKRKNKNAVTMTADMGNLPDGTAYPAKVVLDIKSEKIKVEIKNTGYRKVRP